MNAHSSIPPHDPLAVDMRPIASVKPASRNARRHSDRQIAQVEASIRRYGFINPIIVDVASVVVAGHARLEAARRMGLVAVPVIPVSHLSDAELRAYRLADNKIATNADWDQDILRIELSELAMIDTSSDFEVPGFSTTEIDLAMEVIPANAKLEEQPDLEPREVTGVERGDLWQLGAHRLLCGDARDPASFARLMGEDLARMVFSDPPFNVKVDGHVGGLGRTKHAEFAMASGEMSREEFTEFLAVVFGNAHAVSIDGAIHYQCMDWRHIPEMIMAGERIYASLENMCTWVKDNGGMGSFYRSQHELVFVWKVGTAPHLNNVELGRNGRYRTNVWNYRGATKTGADAELTMHPTVKPVPMIMDAIKDTSKRGEIVLDPFGGSGSTLLAAHKTGRVGRLIEYEPKYCAVTIRRWEKLAKREAVLLATGETFAEVHARRNAEIERLADLALGEAA
ncbi:site-specific DNA-methyltransferase [Sphingomonas adhaesiva]|uniref:site-specific DNA-methyltransferase n=1 Tax=Sphingomonas adhaesiva TaxID=28212 RepID=UPI002FFA7584